MERYFLHLRDGTAEILDPDGMLIPHGGVEHEVLRAARDCISHDVRSGVLDLKLRIDAHDAAGALVHTLRFRDALIIKAET